MNILLQKFEEIDNFNNFPSFENLEKILDQALWVLLVCKEKNINGGKLTAKQISEILIECMNVSTTNKSISNSFNRSKGRKVHKYHEKKNLKTKYKIMDEGIAHLNKNKEDIKVFYFEPGKKYGSKMILSRDILKNLNGELKIIDPYCDKKTLDILNNCEKDKIKFLTKMDNLGQRKVNSFLRELRDFNHDNPHIKFKDYPFNDIHDRYVISKDSFIIIGYSLKDFGKKETFVSVFKNNEDIHKNLEKNFDEKWKNSRSIP